MYFLCQIYIFGWSLISIYATLRGVSTAINEIGPGEGGGGGGVLTPHFGRYVPRQLSEKLEGGLRTELEGENAGLRSGCGSELERERESGGFRSGTDCRTRLAGTLTVCSTPGRAAALPERFWLQ